MEYSKEFKEALSNFTPKEKDKLIVRLLRKDKILSQKLYFELIEEKTVDEKRQELEDSILHDVEAYAKTVTNPKYFMMLMRKISGEITLHVKVTTDKFGEVYLNLLLVNKILEFYKARLKRQSFDQNYKLYIYLINKIFRALVLSLKLDRDYYMEIDEILGETERLATEDSAMMRLCINNQLDFKYLLLENVPENLAEIVREIKKEGFLR